MTSAKQLALDLYNQALILNEHFILKEQRRIAKLETIKEQEKQRLELISLLPPAPPLTDEDVSDLLTHTPRFATNPFIGNGHFKKCDQLAN